MVTQYDNVLFALPKRSTLNQFLRHARTSSRVSNYLIFLPFTHDLTFGIPFIFRYFILFDSNPDNEIIILIGDSELGDNLSWASLWLTARTIYFQYSGAMNPAAVYFMLANKTKHVYHRILIEITRLVPTCTIWIILTNFETTVMCSIYEAFPSATISADVSEAFDLLAESLPRHEKMYELLSYFKHTYIRGRRVRGREENCAPSVFNRSQKEYLELPSREGLTLLSPASVFVQPSYDVDKTIYLQTTSGVEDYSSKIYSEIQAKVFRAVKNFGRASVRTYVRCLANLS
ncbi:hypothetical protein RF11_03682 [Thelohanellus kitauei]|uniref:MULE transposase domain-containing protein n=1 Tax=Thelohanellus kitauei TaxID=669202 RepID=A0A0C2MSG5_THEKT|nr:hypothetical protein RF11_03682 [Thelohanellus kitauei]